MTAITESPDNLPWLDVEPLAKMIADTYGGGGLISWSKEGQEWIRTNARILAREVMQQHAERVSPPVTPKQVAEAAEVRHENPWPEDADPEWADVPAVRAELRTVRTGDRFWSECARGWFLTVNPSADADPGNWHWVKRHDYLSRKRKDVIPASSRPGKVLFDTEHMRGGQVFWYRSPSHNQEHARLRLECNGHTQMCDASPPWPSCAEEVAEAEAEEQARKKHVADYNTRKQTSQEDTERSGSEMGKRLSHEVTLARRSVARAKAMLGDGWAHVSRDVRWGLVSSEILGIYLSQDNKADPSGSTRAFIQAVTSAAMDIVFPDNDTPE